MTAMNNKDLALLTTKLHVPLIVRDMLEAPENFAADINYNLHDIISDMQPDAAILSMALSIQRICQNLPKDSYVPALEIACDRIIDDYGPCWLAHANDEDVDNSYLMELLTHLPEDLETLNEFMDLVMAFVPEDSMAYDILETMRIQAGAHSLIAETFLEAAEAQYSEEIKSLELETPITMIQQESNVIAFPGARTV